MRWVVILVLFATATRAGAAPCHDEGVAAAALNALDRFAKDANAKIDISYLERCDRDLVDAEEPSPKRNAFFLTACKTILARDGAHPTCIRGAIHLGKKALAGIDFLTELRAWEHDPWKGGGRVLPLYVELGHRDAVIRVLEVWKSSMDEAAHREQTLEGWQRKQSRLAWSQWRQQATAVFRALGEPDVTSFLAEQAKSTDRSVARACLDAIRAIERRREKANARP